MEGKICTVVGESLVPYYESMESFIRNKVLLIRLLNEGNVFDEPLYAKEKDRLELSFYCHTEEERLTYGFAYYNGEWKEESFNSLDWLREHNSEIKGKITSIMFKQTQLVKFECRIYNWYSAG
jgi:hypothetical protein